MKASSILRVLAILAGVLSCTILAWRGLDVKLAPGFAAFLELIEDFASIASRPLERYLLHPILDLLRSVGLDLTLYSHWKHFFVLLWLWFGAFARTSGPGGGSALWAWGLVAALATGTISGLFMLTSMWTFACPILGTIVWYIGAIQFVRSTESGGLDFFGFGVAAGALGVYAGPAWYSGSAISSGPLPLIALFLVIGSVLNLLTGAILARGPGNNYIEKFLNDPSVVMGLDVLAVLGGATAIVTMNQLLVGRW